MEQFLNKIPKSVVKNGKVIDIRNSLQEKITVCVEIVLLDFFFWFSI